MILAIVVAILVVLAFMAFMNRARFGRLPAGKRLETIRKSPNYREGAFQNQSFTPSLTDGATYYSIMKGFFFGKTPRTSPVDIIPSVKTNLRELDIKSDVLVWFGHSSYYMQVDGKRILVDPVFSGAAAPVSFLTQAFNGTDIYKSDDIPEIDYLFISHDHWDHLDYKTLLELKPKIKKIICALGVGEHFERWGFDQSIVIEKDWNEQVDLDNGFTAYTIPARHFSGRGFKRNQSLWMSWVLKTPTMKIFIGGDSGYDKHFAEAGKSFGPFDLAILENGQYDKSWKHIHMMPDEFFIAAKELNAKRVLAVHSSKFKLGNHPWDEPLIRVSALSKKTDVQLITPRIGEKVNLKDGVQQFTEWWKGIN